MGDFLVERIFYLMEKNKITAKELSKIIDVKANSFSGWKSGVANPSVSAIIEIAKYFNVSCDWIMTGKNFEESEDVMLVSDPNEKQLISNFREISKQGQDFVLEYSDAATYKYKKLGGHSGIEAAKELT